MASKILPALGLVGAIAFIPATTAGIAQVDVSAVREISQFMNVLERVKAEYVDQVDDATLIRGAIDGMLSGLDPHSSFLDARAMSAMMTQTEGNYGGLGLTVSMEDGAVKVISATRGTPADRAGIKPGDFITHIDGRLFYGGTLDEAVDRMRGPPGTSVRITVVRPGRERPFDVTITRATIDIPALRWEVRDRVGIINITTFLNRNTADLTRRAMADIERQLGGPPLGYIIDLRSNGGGLLEESVNVADLFLERGEVVSQRGRRRTDIERFYAQPGDAAHGLPVIVLVDAGTASASEIVAAALQDHRRAIIMGERTFGKGSVQTLLPLGDGSAIRLTTARYFTPSGRSVQEGGVTPDIFVPQISDPDYRLRNRIRESDLRRHLVNEAGVQDDLIQDDGRPDPRFAATPAELTERGITDFQLHYALQTIARLARAQQPRIAGAGAPPRGRRR